jgi:hypothetical protein
MHDAVNVMEALHTTSEAMVKRKCPREKSNSYKAATRAQVHLQTKAQLQGDVDLFFKCEGGAASALANYVEEAAGAVLENHSTMTHLAVYDNAKTVKQASEHCTREWHGIPRTSARCWGDGFGGQFRPLP